ncbi:MAG: YkgJ family cysteine cluster protein [Acidobacteria bacterium]|nr:YkgJ family cysteine cluster protein [Acidobacteriota bacterium]
MPEGRLTPEEILRDYPRLGPDDRFTFRCDPGVDCFTHCCANVSIVLAPYDVLRLKRALGLDSTEFLERYTISPFAPDQKIPAVLLKMDPETRRCPLVGEAGCRVYAHRPWACRMYPLGSAEPRNPTPTERGFHFLLREPLCHGHDQGGAWTVREWTQSQGVEEYDAMGALYRDLMLHEFWDQQEPLSPQKMEMYFMACYDLDRFRRFVFETRFLELFEVDEARVEAIRTDDEALLEFAMQWLRFSLLGERSMRLKPSVIAARRRAAQEAAARP